MNTEQGNEWKNYSDMTNRYNAAWHLLMDEKNHAKNGGRDVLKAEFDKCQTDLKNARVALKNILEK